MAVGRRLAVEGASVSVAALLQTAATASPAVLAPARAAAGGMAVANVVKPAGRRRRLVRLAQGEVGDVSGLFWPMLVSPCDPAVTSSVSAVGA